MIDSHSLIKRDPKKTNAVYLKALATARGEGQPSLASFTAEAPRTQRQRREKKRLVPLCASSALSAPLR
jgi:hypothetical protein